LVENLGVGVGYILLGRNMLKTIAKTNEKKRSRKKKRRGKEKRKGKKYIRMRAIFEFCINLEILILSR